MGLTITIVSLVSSACISSLIVNVEIGSRAEQGSSIKLNEGAFAPAIQGPPHRAGATVRRADERADPAAHDLQHQTGGSDLRQGGWIGCWRRWGSSALVPLDWGKFFPLPQAR